MSVMSDASIATSAPVPIAIPTSARARAGASLIPSPTIATMRPAAWSRSTTSALSAGQHVGEDPMGRDPDLARRPRRRWPRPSPVASQTSMPGRVRVARPRRDASALTGSLIGDEPGGAPVDRDLGTASARRPRPGRVAAWSGARSTPRSRRSRAVPTMTARASRRLDVPVDPTAGDGLEAVDGPEAELVARAPGDGSPRRAGARCPSRRRRPGRGARPP